MELQNATLKQQQFENTFFNLLSSYNEFLEKENKILLKFWESCVCDNSEEKYLTYFQKVINENQDKVNNFLVLIKLILKFVDTKCETDKLFYNNLIFSQTHKEILLILYYDLKNSKTEFAKYPFFNDFSTFKLVQSGHYILPPTHQHYMH